MSVSTQNGILDVYYDDISSIITAIHQLKNKNHSKEEKDSIWIKRFRPELFCHEIPNDPLPNQFVVLLKPEATNAKGLLSNLMNIFGAFHKNNLKVHAIRVLGGSYLERHNIMVKHYGVINHIYNEGYAAISEEAKMELSKVIEKLEETPNRHDGEIKIVGGKEFLSKHPEISAEELFTINTKIKSQRLASGTYVLVFHYKGNTWLILNAFHGYQLSPYNNPEKGIVAMVLTSADCKWDFLRDKVCGKTDPTRAAAGSIRNNFFKDQKSGFLADMSNNGVHFSAGPLEAMAEMVRFMSNYDELTKILDYVDDTPYGELLFNMGLSKETINQLASNCNVVYEGKVVGSYDLTE